jgi:hypothetical protein
MEKLETPDPAFAPPAEKNPVGKMRLFQTAAIILAVPVVAWGIFVVWATTSFTPCGPAYGFVQLGVVGSWMIAVPSGLFALVAALTIKNSSPSLRQMCLITSVVVLIPPIIASIFLSRWHCS